MSETNELNTAESKILSLCVERAKEQGIKKELLLEIIDSVYEDDRNPKFTRKSETLPQ